LRREQPGQLDELAGLVLHAGLEVDLLAVAQHDALGPNCCVQRRGARSNTFCSPSKRRGARPRSVSSPSLVMWRDSTGPMDVSRCTW